MKKITKRGLFLGRKASSDRKKRDYREYEEYDRDYDDRDTGRYDDYDDYDDDRDYDDRRYDMEYEVYDDNRGYRDDRDYDDYDYDRDYEDNNRDYVDDRKYGDIDVEYDNNYKEDDYDRDYADDDCDYVDGDDYGHGYADDDRYYSGAAHNYDDNAGERDYRDESQYDSYDYDRDYADDDREYAEDANRFEDEDLQKTFGGDNEYDNRYIDDDYEYDGGFDDRYDDEEYGRGYKASIKGGYRSGKYSSKKHPRRRAEDDYDEGPGAVFARFGKALKNTTAVERIAAAVAVVIISGAIVTGVFYSKAIGKNNEISAFADVGSTIGDVQIVGQNGLVAVADAEKAKVMTAEIIDEAKTEATEEEEKKEEEEVKGGKVNVNLSSIKSDLKIKFVGSNKKLVAKVPFKVTVETPDGSTVDYEDDDRDGIIYKKDMKAGTYKVTPKELPSDFSQYTLDTSTKTVTVKDKVEMKAVDVSDEVKKESQVNVAKEDTAVKNVVESTLKDTVEYVESEKIPLDGSDTDGSGTYKEINKSDIPNPMSQSSIIDFANFRTVALFTEGNALPASNDASSEATTKDSSSSNTASTEKPAENTEEQTPSEEELKKQEEEKKKKEQEEADRKTQEEADKKAKEEADKKAKDEADKKAKEEAEKAEIEKNGSVPVKETSITLAVGETKTIDFKVDTLGSIRTSANNSNVKVDGLKITGVSAGTSEVTVTAAKYKEAKITVTVTAKKELKIKADKFDKTVNETIAAADYLDTNAADCKFTSDNTKVATVASNGDIKLVAKGTAKITITAYNQSEIVTVTVKDAPAKNLPIKFKKVTLVEEEKVSIGINANDYPGLKGTSKDGSVAGVSGTDIQGKKGGKTTTVTFTATGYNAFEIQVTVVGKKELLKLADGTQVYIKGSDGKFREATYADYYNKEKFYLLQKGEGNYKYKGWQTIGGKTYYYNKNCEYVTGEQVIQGAKYVFGSDGVLSTSSGSRGIDVSKWNGSIDWKAVKNEGIDFVIIRCGYRGSSAGALIEDPTFRTNIKGAQAAGLKVGVYFFTQAVNEAEAVEEASMVIELCKGYSISCPVYLDVEGSNGRGDSISAAQRTANIKAFCGTIQNAGYKAGVYANKTWFTSKINTPQLTNYKIWLAQYAASPTYTATRYDMWQHTSKGRVSGISGNVDLNTLYR